MSNSKDIQELSIAGLFLNDQYTIPIYQRNYAWGETEVEQLLQDILDIAKQGLNTTNSYYLGSLVAYQRKDGRFEIIDGQQRHTTLGIILSVLKNEFKQVLGEISRINLGFDSRVKSDETLRALFSGRKPDIEERTIRSAYEVITRFLVNEKAHVEKFKNFLLNNVKILRVVVPEDTDLNHYFEIMNNRGEQLEKHEILKARLMNELVTGSERKCFAIVWDACAEMNRYIQLSFPAKKRIDLFGKEQDFCSQDFDKLCEILSEPDVEKVELSLNAIIKDRKFMSAQKLEKEESGGTFNSIINFSNFLLHVLRVMTKEDVPLDDKRLLDVFAEYQPNAKQFVVALCKCRILFDRYIIKRENDLDWSLKSFRIYQNKNTSFGYVNSNNNDKTNQALVMLISMFHVSYPALVYKHWLNGALNYLYNETDDKLDVDGSNYLFFLEQLSHSFFYGRYGCYEKSNGEESIEYFDLIYKEPILPKSLNPNHLKQGTGVQNFIFNRLDYLLWKRLIAGESFEGVDAEYLNKRLNGFSFTFRTSVEHYFPQNPVSGEKLLKSDKLPDGVDSFGNLCLISNSNNSILSNNLPKDKKKHYENSKTVESLKQVFMMSYQAWGPESVKSISQHEAMMIEVLCDE